MNGLACSIALFLSLQGTAQETAQRSGPPESLLAMAGTYVAEETRRTIHLTPREVGGRWILLLTDTGTGDIRGLFPAGEDELTAGETLMRPEPVAYGIHFTRAPSGAVEGLELHEEATDSFLHARRLPERTVAIAIESAGTRLEGALHLPEGKGPFPAVVLVHGSEGGQDRYSFDALPGALVQRGIAVLAYDKRGCGRSQGSWDVPHELLAADVCAAVSVLRAREEIGPCIGLIGFSEGAWIAPLAASRCEGIAFLVALCGGALPKSESLLHQATRRLESQGLGAAEVEAGLAAPRALLAESRERIAEGQPTAFDLRQMQDPTPTWQAFRGPILFLIGEFDTLVPPQGSAARLRAVLAAAQHPDYTIQVFPKAHHGMFLGITGSTLEFERMEGIASFVPGYWSTLLLWLDEHTAGPARSR